MSVPSSQVSATAEGQPKILRFSPSSLDLLFYSKDGLSHALFNMEYAK